MKGSTALPVLRILPSAALVLHEEVDPRRVERLSKRILEESFLKNPPIVAEVPGTDKFVVLDGANRSRAFQQAGIPHIVAQIVSYDDPGVILDTWYHVIAGIPWLTLESELRTIPNLQLLHCTQKEGRAAVDNGKAVAYMINDDCVCKFVPYQDAGISKLALLNSIVSTYKGKADIFRASNDIWEIQKPYYPKITALVVYPPVKPEDILEAGKNGEKIPSGITRHIIPTRALNINIPLGILMADWPLERKREWLDEWVMERMSANAIRYYAESTFSFNE